MKRKILSIALALALALAMTGCGARLLKENEINYDFINGEDKGIVRGSITIGYLEIDDDDTENPDDLIRIEWKFELDYASAPNTVANFYRLGTDGFYDNTLVNSVTANDTTGISMGTKTFAYGSDDDGKEDKTKTDYTATRTVDCGWKIAGEFSKNGWERNKNEVKYLSMYMNLASAEDYNSASSGFSISLKDDENPDSKTSMGKLNCVFGKIVDTDGALHDFTENINKTISLSTSFKAPRILKVTFDKEYDLKLVK